MGKGEANSLVKKSLNKKIVEVGENAGILLFYTTQSRVLMTFN